VPSAMAERNVLGGADLGPSSISSSRVEERRRRRSDGVNPVMAGQTSDGVRRPMIAPPATAFELMPISYMPPAWSVTVTMSFRSAISPCA